MHTLFSYGFWSTWYIKWVQRERVSHCSKKRCLLFGGYPSLGCAWSVWGSLESIYLFTWIYWSCKAQLSSLAWVAFPLRPWTLHMDYWNDLCLLPSNFKLNNGWKNLRKQRWGYSGLNTYTSLTRSHTIPSLYLMDPYNCVYMFTKCHPVLPELHFNLFCMAWKDNTGDIYLTDLHLTAVVLWSKQGMPALMHISSICDWVVVHPTRRNGWGQEPHWVCLEAPSDLPLSPSLMSALRIPLSSLQPACCGTKNARVIWLGAQVLQHSIWNLW